MNPSVGRIVHYVSYGTPNGEYKPAHRAAIITDVRLQGANDPSPEHGDGPEYYEIRATIFNPDGTFNSPWLKEDQLAQTPGTWHWPEREA